MTISAFRNPDLEYEAAFSSFAGTDIRALVSVPSTETEEPVLKILGNIQTISYSIFREKMPVRALGFVGEKGKSRGTRTIAGSLVFTVFDRHVLWDVMRRQHGDSAKNATTPDYDDLEYIVPDQLPPFDILIHFANEYGHAAEMALYGIEIHSEGQVMSIQDMITENVMQFTARHIAIMRPGGYRSAKKGGFFNSERTFTSIMHSSNSPAANLLIQKANNPFR